MTLAAATAVVALSILAALTFTPSLRCLLWKGTDCEATQSPIEAKLGQSPAPRAPSAPAPVEEDTQRLYGTALLEAAKALRDNNYRLTPRQLAHAFVGVMGGSTTEGQLLASMFASSPRDPDRFLSGDNEDVEALRRYAAVLASTRNQLSLPATLELANPTHDDDARPVGDEPSVAATFEAFSRAAKATEPAKPHPWRPTTSSTARGFLFGTLALGLIALIGGAWRATRVNAARLVRAVGDALGTKATLVAPTPTFIGAPRARLARIAQDLTRREKTSRQELDLKATVNASVKRLGFLTPCYKPRAALIETVFLLNRRGRHDQARDRIAETIDALKALGAPVARYDYSQEPRFLFRGDDWGWDRAVPLMKVRDVHADARIVVVSDGNEFVDRVTFQPFAWVRKFLDWPDVVVLAPSILGVPGAPAGQFKKRAGMALRRSDLERLGANRAAQFSQRERPARPQSSNRQPSLGAVCPRAWPTRTIACMPICRSERTSRRT